MVSMNAVTDQSVDIPALMDGIGTEAVKAARALAQASTELKNAALRAAAAAIREQRADILAANELDVRDAKSRGLSGALVDRLLLDYKCVEAVAKGMEEIIA